MRWRFFRGRRRSQNAALTQALQLAAEGRRAAIYERATGLYAYWYLELRVEEEIGRAERGGRPVSCISLWADTPDGINGLVAAVHENLRIYDMAAYLNNGHVVVVPLETDAVGAQVMLNRIVLATEGDVLAGVASHPDDGRIFEELLTRAKERAQRADAA